jgi:thioredoxin-like negative regulator of GroEL
MIGNVVLVYHGTFQLPLLAAESNATAAVGLLRQHRFAEAAALAQTAAQQAPDSADVNFVLGQALFASGHAAEGRQAMANALRLAQTIQPEYQKYIVSMVEHPRQGP